METKYMKFQPYKWRFGLLWMSYVGVFVYALITSGGEDVGIILLLILGLSFLLVPLYFFVIRLIGFYPIFGQDRLKVKHIKFSKCDKDFKYDDIQSATVMWKHNKIIGNIMILWLVFKDGSKMKVCLLTHLKLRDELCQDLAARGITVNNQF